MATADTSARTSHTGLTVCCRLLALATILLGLALSLGIIPRAESQAPAGGAVLLQIDGAIGPATADYVAKGLEEAQQKGAKAVILSMDTPGGLDTAMRSIIRDILASPIPVITYVSPSGARAASAGTYILYASHVAAMAPGTNLGAATPVQLGGGLPIPGIGGETPKDEEKGDATAPADAHEAKAINDAIAYIRSLAEMRGRNVEWAEQAVRQAASLPASQAVEMHVADFMANDLQDLLEKADGRTVMAGGREVTLQTAGLAVERIQPGWRSDLLAAITDPNVALILMMIGIYGLLLEFLHPGALLPGAMGGICLILGLYALNTLPVNYAGLALILLGIALSTAEAFVPSFGVLGLSGIAAFVLGAIILMDTDAPGYQIAWPAIAGVVVMSLLVTFIVAPFAVRSQRRKVVSGREEMIGAAARVVDWEGGHGHVFVHSENWQAEGPNALDPGQTVQVTEVNGLKLTVQSIQPDTP